MPLPKLLLSVRSAPEAALALAAGVDLIDVKEPLRGPLGAAASETIDEILRLAGRSAATSVAYGELLQCELNGGLRDPRGGTRFEATLWPDYVKVGLSGCASISDWPRRWGELLESMHPRATPVAVIYADGNRANSPPPAEIVAQARQLKHAAVLIDTYDKRGPGLLRLCSLAMVQALIDEVHASHMEIAVAGQLTLDDALAVAPLKPDYIGVRGAVCRPDRNGDIDPQALSAWRRAIAAAGRRETTSRSAYTRAT
jgi:uncharacterized protein (UPF0264 family)